MDFKVDTARFFLNSYTYPWNLSRIVCGVEIKNDWKDFSCHLPLERPISTKIRQKACFYTEHNVVKKPRQCL